MAETAPRPALTGRPRPQEEQHGNGLLLFGLLLAGAGVAVYETRKHSGVGCAANHPTPLSASTLYQTNPSGITWFVDHTGVQRWGVPSQMQMQRCFTPAQIAATVVTTDSVFGNADNNQYVPIVGTIMACSTCPS